jgi:hypothetical protein
LFQAFPNLSIFNWENKAAKYRRENLKGGKSEERKECHLDFGDGTLFRKELRTVILTYTCI